MLLQLSIDESVWQCDCSAMQRISIPLCFDGPQPRHFGAPRAAATALQTDGFVGDTRQGGSCNVFSYQLIPHCNGTHTEGPGHILNSGGAVNQLGEVLFPATLITVEPQSAVMSDDTYLPPLEASDRIITRRQLEAALAGVPAGLLPGLIVRTLPNDAEKCRRDYLAEPPAFFSREAMQFIGTSPVRHLLTDLPSIDRLFDDGHLSGHHTFWEADPAARHNGAAGRPDRTITEMVYIPDSLGDGSWLVALQIPDFVADAAPSRVLIAPLTRATG